MPGGRTNRRAFIAGLGGAAAWPLVASGQQPKPLVFYLIFGAAGDTVDRFPAFLRGLSEVGYVDGRNVTIERPPLTNPEELRTLVPQIVQRNPSAIYSGTLGTAAAIRKETETIPIVFTTSGDPVSLGLVASISRPGGFTTGTLLRAGEELTKLLELLHQLVPAATTLGMLINPAVDAGAERDAATVEVAGSRMGLRIIVQRADKEEEFPSVFAALSKDQVGGLLISDTRYLAARRNQLATLALQYSIPAITDARDFALAGGLASYGPNVGDAFRQAGVYVGRILNGEKPSDLPILQPTTFAFVINLKTAKALGLEIPPALLARADEVIE
jgi:putative tryptophan/tyrosine transport system substrate-binding protein